MSKTDYFNIMYIPKHDNVKKNCDFDILFIDATYYENGQVSSMLKILDENIACQNFGYNGKDPKIWENESLFLKHLTNITHAVVKLQIKSSKSIIDRQNL